MSRHRVSRKRVTKDDPLTNCLASCAFDRFAGLADAGASCFVGTTRSSFSLGTMLETHRWFHKRDLVQLLSLPPSFMIMRRGR